jgi:hypothetical protein
MMAGFTYELLFCTANWVAHLQQAECIISAVLGALSFSQRGVEDLYGQCIGLERVSSR